MALRAGSFLGSRLWAAGSSTLLLKCATSRHLSFLSHNPSTAAPAASGAVARSDEASAIFVDSAGDMLLDPDVLSITPSTAGISTATAASSEEDVIIVSSASDMDGDVMDNTHRREADRIARAAAALEERALRGGFVPSPDAHLETTSQFGGPSAAAMSNMVEAVYGTFAGDSRGVERSVEHLTHGTAGAPHKPLATRWTRSSVVTAAEDDEEAAAIRETLNAYRFAGMGSRAFTPEPEEAAAAATQNAQAVTNGAAAASHSASAGVGAGF